MLDDFSKQKKLSSVLDPSKSHRKYLSKKSLLSRHICSQPIIGIDVKLVNHKLSFPGGYGSIICPMSPCANDVPLYSDIFSSCNLFFHFSVVRRFLSRRARQLFKLLVFRIQIEFFRSFPPRRETKAACRQEAFPTSRFFGS